MAVNCQRYRSQPVGSRKRTSLPSGNCSSPTVLLVLDRIRRREARTVVLLAFGPGLTLYAALLS